MKTKNTIFMTLDLEFDLPSDEGPFLTNVSLKL